MREIQSSHHRILFIKAPPVLLSNHMWSPLLRPRQGPRRLVEHQPTCPDASSQKGRREGHVNEAAKGLPEACHLSRKVLEMTTPHLHLYLLDEIFVECQGRLWSLALHLVAKCPDISQNSYYQEKEKGY